MPATETPSALVPKLTLDPDAFRHLGYRGAQVGIVTFVPGAPGASLAELDEICTRLPSAALDDGFAFLSTHRVRGTTALRLCTINPRTTREDVTRTMDRLTHLAEGALS